MYNNFKMCKNINVLNIFSKTLLKLVLLILLISVSHYEVIAQINSIKKTHEIVVHIVGLRVNFTDDNNN